MGIDTRFSFFKKPWLLNIEPPVRRFRCPRGCSWTEFKLACGGVEPVNIVIDKMSRKIANEYGPRNEP